MTFAFKRRWQTLAFLALVALVSAAHPQTFEQRQLSFPRVREAKSLKDSSLRRLVLRKGLKYPLHSVFIRVFKEERALELWGKDASPGQFTLVKTYQLSAFSGELGPKRASGDMQIPEGFYVIEGPNSFNPNSSFHLSMLIDYPNASDRILGKRRSLGGQICIHGSDVTIGCLPITDDGIREVYWLAVQAMSGGQRGIPVHIFPCRLDSSGMIGLANDYRGFKDALGHDLISFWRNLQEGYRWFESRKQLPDIRVGNDGIYQFR